jgi:hypothetical protein
MESKYQLHHGKEFRDFLEARDQVLEHSFDFSFELRESDLPSGSQTFFDSRLY